MAGRAKVVYANQTAALGQTGLPRVIHRGEPYPADSDLVKAYPQVFADTLEEALTWRPKPTRTCRQCGGHFELDGHPDKLYCGKACRRARERLLARAGRIVNRQIEPEPRDFQGVQKWLEDLQRDIRMVEELRGHLSGRVFGGSPYPADGINLALEGRGELLRQANKWRAKAQQRLYSGRSSLAAYARMEQEKKRQEIYARRTAEAHGQTNALQAAWASLFNKLDPEDKLDPEGTTEAERPNAEPSVLDPGVY